MFINKKFDLGTLKKLERKVINLTEIALEKNILSGGNDYQKFVIICRKRTGSNFLVSLLQSHPKIRAFGEVFGDDEQIHWGYPSYSSAKVLQTRKKDPIKFLDQIVFRDFLKSTKAVGFKLLYQEESNFSKKTVCEYLQRIKNLNVIHLKRKNILANYVSWQIAKKTDVWILLKQQNNHKQTLEIDYEDCLNYFQKTKALEKEHEIFFAKHSKQTHTLYYEDLVANTEKEIQEIQQFLGLESLPLTPYTKKQETRHIKEIITNYDELKEKFEDTPWQTFF
ncbi:MAG: Stf0 family sulfotransferase [Candidatus Nanopelagicaceae bacterium]